MDLLARSDAARPDPLRDARGEPRLALWLAFGFLLSVQAAALAAQRTPIFEDDVLFFFRYAESLAAGRGFRFNPGEAPVWGASAPLWPLLIALGMQTGLDAAQSCLLLSWILALASTLVLGLLARHLFGLLGVLALTPILAFHHLHTTWCTSGMETPLTLFLVALGLWAASGRGGGLFIGSVAGLCLVHKLDLAPFGLALLAGTWLWRREHFAKAWPVAAGIAALWYGFATWHFGSPLPNSFLVKVRASHGNVSRWWFSETSLVKGGGLLRTGLALLGLLALRRQRFLAAMVLTQILVPTLAYTLKPPAERFTWYPAATSSALAFLAAAGLSWLLRARPTPPPRSTHAALALVPIVALGVFLQAREARYVRGWHGYLDRNQRPLKQAGEWVDEHARPDWRVITFWGNPAYYSRRVVIDGTYLNRRPESGDPFELHRPEVWIHCSFGSIADFTPRRPYQIVETFEAPSPGNPFYVAVLLRAELVPELEARAAIARFVERLRRGDVVESDPELELLARTIRRNLAALPEAQRLETLREWPELEQLAPPAARSR